MAAAIRGKRTVPCVLSIQLPEGDAEGDATAPATMHLYRAGARRMAAGGC